MMPLFKTPRFDDFGEECRTKFLDACAARMVCPFHVDKRKFEAIAWEAVDACLDWLEINDL